MPLKNEKTIDRMLRLSAVSERVGLSKPSIYRLIRDGAFPAPIQVGPRAARWPESEIEAYIASRPRGPSGPGPNPAVRPAEAA